MLLSAVSAAVRKGARTYTRRNGAVVHASLDDDVVENGLCDGGVTSRAGYFDLNASQYDVNGDKNYYFWMFESHNDPSTDPVVLWLTGGPGCASTLALVTENGPCKVNSAGDGTIPNPYGWNRNATVIWLDQPAGVGFSYGTENDSNELMVGEDAFYFLQTFFAAHPQYASQPFFVFGESYGGHYAPAVAHTIYTMNAEYQAAAASSASGAVNIRLTGLGVGNGLTDPVTQYAYYPQMAMNNSYVFD